MVINNENFVIRKLNNDIISTLNASPAPIEAKRLILENALNLVTKNADKIVTYEIRSQKGDLRNGRLSENKLAEHTEHQHTDQSGESESHGAGDL